MGFVKWGDRLDDRIVRRIQRPPRSLRSADTDVTEWWQQLPREARNDFLLDVQRGVIFRDPLLARARVAALEFYSARGVFVPLAFLMPLVVALSIAAFMNEGLESTFALVIVAAMGVLGFAVGRRIQRERLESARVIAELVAELADAREAGPMSSVDG
jgi:hypothetical protein